MQICFIDLVGKGWEVVAALVAVAADITVAIVVCGDMLVAMTGRAQFLTLPLRAGIVVFTDVIRSTVVGEDTRSRHVGGLRFVIVAMTKETTGR